MNELGKLRHEPSEKRIRASLDGQTVIDTTRALLVWEPKRVVPTYAVPVDDIAGDIDAAPAAGRRRARRRRRDRRAAARRPCRARSQRPVLGAHHRRRARCRCADAAVRARPKHSGPPILPSRATSPSTSMPSMRGTRRTNATSPIRGTRSIASTSSTARAMSASSSTARCWPRAPGPHCSSNRRSPFATTYRSTT